MCWPIIWINHWQISVHVKGCVSLGPVVSVSLGQVMSVSLGQVMSLFRTGDECLFRTGDECLFRTGDECPGTAPVFITESFSWERAFSVWSLLDACATPLETQWGRSWSSGRQSALPGLVWYIPEGPRSPSGSLLVGWYTSRPHDEPGTQMNRSIKLILIGKLNQVIIW